LFEIQTKYNENFEEIAHLIHNMDPNITLLTTAESQQVTKVLLEFDDWRDWNGEHCFQWFCTLPLMHKEETLAKFEKHDVLGRDLRKIQTIMVQRGISMEDRAVITDAVTNMREYAVDFRWKNNRA
jgi:hypothetical protein